MCDDKPIIETTEGDSPGCPRNPIKYSRMEIRKITDDVLSYLLRTKKVFPVDVFSVALNLLSFVITHGNFSSDEIRGATDEAITKAFEFRSRKEGTS